MTTYAEEEPAPDKYCVSAITTLQTDQLMICAQNDD